MLDDLQALAEGLTSRLDRGVAIDDVNFRLLVHTAHHGPMDEARVESLLRMEAPGPVIQHLRSLRLDRKPANAIRIAGVDSLSLLARVCAPVRIDDQLFGFLWLIDPDMSLTDDDLVVVAQVAHAAAIVIQRQRLLKDVQAGRRRELLRDLLSDDEGLRIGAADALASIEGGISGPVQALIVRIPVSTLNSGEDFFATVDAALARATRRTLTKRGLYLSRINLGLLVFATPELEATGRRLAAAARDEIKKVLPNEDVHSAMGDPVERLSDLVTSYDQAVMALKTSELVTTFGSHVAWSDLGVYQILVHLPLESMPEGLVLHQLTELLDAPSGQDLIRTVEVYLDEAADVRTTVARLNIHRTSLYYRLRRFTELTGLDLCKGDERLSIHLGLKFARLIGVNHVVLPHGGCPGSRGT